LNRFAAVFRLYQCGAQGIFDPATGLMLVVGVPLNAASFVPAAALTPLPPVTAIIVALNALAAAAPELRAGSGDLLVADTGARLPFAASHTTNALNHLEALYDHGLQSQVTALLLAQRNPLVSGVATAKLSPFPAKQGQSSQYHVVAHLFERIVRRAKARFDRSDDRSVRSRCRMGRRIHGERRDAPREIPPLTRRSQTESNA
jgi:hypothetical protein